MGINIKISQVLYLLRYKMRSKQFLRFVYPYYCILTINSNVSIILSMLMPVVSISNSATYPFS